MLKEQYKIFNERDAKAREERSKWYIDTFDEYYDHEKIVKWFSYDNLVEKVSNKSKTKGIAPLKIYNKRD